MARTPVAIAAVIALCACRSRAPETKALPDPAPFSTPKAPSRLDELLRSYEEKLPEPETLSEQNGASLKCEHHGWVTYTHLYALAQKLPFENDADLVRLIPRARSRDVCVRQIAIQAIITRIKFDSNNISLPGMHEPDHYHFHDIFVALKAYLDAHNIAVYSGAFADLRVSVTPNDFAMMKGTWHEEATGKNFLTSIDYDGAELRVTRRRVTPDPAWPDHTWTTKMKTVSVNARGQFEVNGEFSVESNAKGYKGSPITPAPFNYSFWPVSADIVWFSEGNGSWDKLRRAK